MSGRASHAVGAGAFLSGLAVAASLAAGESKPAEAPPLRTLLREKTIYLPYQKLKDIYEKEGRGVFLPYEEFLKLWKAAQRKPPPREEVKPPQSAVIRGGVYTGEVTGEAGRFTVTFQVEALQKAWSRCPLPLKGVAIESIEFSDPAALFAPEGNSYVLLLPTRGSYQVTVRFAVPVKTAPGRKSISFGLPKASVSRLEAQLPEAGARVEVSPMVAATKTEEAGGRTKVLAFLGNAEAVTLTWMPPPGKRVEEAPLLLATQQINTHLGERILRITTEVEFRVLRGEADTLSVSLPPQMRLLAVSGENIRQWNAEGDTLQVLLHAALKPPPEGKKAPGYRLRLSMEKILDPMPAHLAVSFPQVQQVIRESGWIVFSHDPALHVRIESAEGLSQLDRSEIPASLRGARGTGFRYLAHPLSLELGVSKIMPVVRAETASVIALGKEEDKWIGFVNYQITKAGIFKVKLSVPDRWNVVELGDGKSVDDFQITEQDGEKTIEVSLSAKAFGRFRLPFALTAPGSAKEGRQTLGPPRLREVKQDRGYFGVSAPKSFSISTVTAEKLTSADVEELFRSGILNALGPEAGMPLTYRYREGGGTVTVELQAKKTEIDALVQHLVDISDSGISFTHLLDYEILYAPVDRLRFKAPQALDSLLTVEAAEKKEVKKVGAEETDSIWEVTLQAPALGTVSVTVTHQTELKALEPGKPLAFSVPLVRPLQVRQQEGFVALRKEGTLEIVPQSTAMESINAADLPDKLRRGRIYGAFRYFAENPTLTLMLTRYEYQELATTVVSLLRFGAILSEEGRLKARAIFMVQNTERQYLEVTFPKDVSIISLKVADKVSQPRRRKENPESRLIPIPVSAGPRGTFPVVVDYDQTLPGNLLGATGSVALSLPVVAENVPITKIEADLYLPPEFLYLGFWGSLRPARAESANLWSRFKDFVNRTLGVEASQAPRAQSSQSRNEPPGVLHREIPRADFLRQRFTSLAHDGTLRFSFVGKTLWRFLDFLVFLIAFLGTFLLISRAPWPPGGSVCGALLVPLVLVWFTRGPVCELASSLFAGAALMCVGLGLRRATRLFRSTRKAGEETPPQADSSPPASEGQTESESETPQEG